MSQAKRITVKYYENSVLKRTMYYIGNYEKEVVSDGSTKEYDYIYTPEGLSAIAVKTNGSRSLYYVQTDHLGSIRVVTTASKAIQTRYYYDARGKQTLMTGTGVTSRGYLAQEHLNDFGLINLNARLYDPVLARFMGVDPYVQAPDFTQSYNRYAYGLNNPLIYADPDGEFFWSVITFCFDFIKTALFDGGLDPTSSTARANAWKNFDPTANWSMTNRAWMIDKGLFQGDFKQIVSRFTWELPQTLLGYTFSGSHNLLGGVKSVSHYGGATVVESYSKNWGAFTLGSYINGERGITADPNNALFQHEYGHYLQSQAYGLFYLSRYAIPSFFDAAGDSEHNYHAVEQDANIRAYKYFMKHVDGFNVRDRDRNYPNGRWWQSANPIKDYNWSLDYNDTANQLALKKGLISPKWWDYVWGPTIIIPGIINIFNLKQ